jgi:tetratricopeptide (TPR) repeat protein
MTRNNDDDTKKDALTSAINKPELTLDKDSLLKIEALQIELQTNPKSLSFAQLADLYLAQNMVDAAETLLTRSLKYHPQSISGHMLMGRVYQSKNQDENAIGEFTICIQKAPTNWACYLLRAQVYLKIQKQKLALKDFKQVLLHNPQHTGVRRSIARLEMLTADEYEDDLFEIKKISEIPTIDSTSQAFATLNTPQVPAQIERVLSLIDAFVVRQDYEKALKLLKECQAEFGDHQEIQSRLLKLSQFENPEKLRPKAAGHISLARQSLIVEKKQKALELLLRRIKESRISPLVYE